MNRNATLHTRKNAKRDPLQGAPGHTGDEDMSAQPSAESQDEARFSAEGAPSAETNTQSTIAEELIQKLGSVFGEETIEKWRSVLSANTADAQAAFYSILRTSIPDLPEDFSLAEIAKLADWKPVKKVKDNPAASAATIAAGVGAFFLVREYLARNPNGTANKLVKDATKKLKKVAKRASELAASVPVSAAAVQGTAKAKKTSSPKAAIKAAGKKTSKTTAKKATSTKAKGKTAAKGKKTKKK